MKKSVNAARLRPTLVCAWCKGVMRNGTPKLSHGICQPCAAQFFGKFRPTSRISRRVPA